MDYLNDDCLVIVLKHLELQDQMVMLEVHPRFKTLMPVTWRRQFKKLDLSLFETHLSLESFSLLMSSICNTVEVLKIKNICPAKFEILMNFIFPKVHVFHFSQRQPQFMPDAAILRVIHSFPNIRSFSPHGRFTGEYFTQFEHLEQLTLSYCSRKFTIGNFAKIMNKYQLKALKLDVFERVQVRSITLPLENITKLEILKVDCEELDWFDNHFKLLTNLKQLIVTCVEQNTLADLCSKLFNGGHENVLSMESCNTDKALATILNSGLRFEKLSVVTDAMMLADTSHIRFDGYQFLRELYFNVCVVGDAPGFAHLLYNIPQLILLSVEECDCSFAEFDIVADRVALNRTEQLTLNLCRNTSSVRGKNEYVKWHQCGESSLLSVIDGLVSPMSYEPIFIVFK